MISAIFTLALLSAGQPSIVTVTILFFTVRFCALAPTGFYRPSKRTLVTDHLEFTGIELDIGTAGALALFSAEETVGKALAVEFEALRFFAIALQSFFECRWTAIGMGADRDQTAIAPLAPTPLTNPHPFCEAH